MNREAERQRLVELADNFLQEELGVCLNKKILRKFAKHILDKGAMVPPCMIGDRVWVNTKYGTIKSTISCIEMTSDKRFCVEIIYNLPYCYNHKINTYGHVGYWESNFEFGKTVFLTREEAEKMLKGEEK